MQTVAGHMVLVSDPYTHTPIGGKRVWVQADLKRDAQKRQRRTGNLAEGVTPPDTGIDLCDDAASEAFSHGSASSLVRRATQEGSVSRHRLMRTWCQR